MEPHNKIINDTAKKFLVPEGLFRIGNSRRWIDDNDWFIIQVEFQPSSFRKGSYLNVGIDFLWERKGLSECLAFAYGSRVLEFVEYKPGFDDEFAAEMTNYADVALKKVTEYRKFRDLEYAKKALKQKAGHRVKKHLNWNTYNWDAYDLAMLCFFKRDFKAGKKYFNKYLNSINEDLYNYHQENICPQIQSAETAQCMVCDMINRRRAFFNSKASYKKMKKDVIF